MREAAEEILYELGIHGVHPEIVKVLGRLKFRTSYGQNQLHALQGSRHPGRATWRPRWASTPPWPSAWACCTTWARG